MQMEVLAHVTVLGGIKGLTAAPRSEIIKLLYDENQHIFSFLYPGT